MKSDVKVRPLSLKENALWNSIGCLIYLGCQWLTTVLVVVFSSNFENSGILAIAMAIGNIFAPIALYRIRVYQVSDTSSEYSSQNYVAFRFITIFGALVFSLAYSVFTGVGASLFPVIGIYLLFKADEAFSDVLYGIDQKNYRMDYIGISQGLRGVLSISLFSVGLIVFDSILLAVAFMAIGCFAVTLLFDIPHSRRFGPLRPHIGFRAAIKLAKTCLPAVISLLFCSAVASIARQYFGLEFGEESLGIYAAVATPAILIQVSASYLYSPAISRISEYYDRREMKQLRGMILKLSGLIFAVVLLLCLALSFFGEPLLVMVYGERIASYVYLLTPVCIATGLFAYVWFLSDVLIVLRDFRGLLVASAGALLSCIICLIPVISQWEMNGVNFVLIISYTVGLALALVFVLKDIRSHKRAL